MRKAKTLMATALVVIMTLACFTGMVFAEEDRVVVKVLAERVRTSSGWDITEIKNTETYKFFDGWLKEKGIEIEFEGVANEQYNTIVQTRLASGTNLPDFFQANLTDTEAVSYGENGILLDILGAIKEYDEDGSILEFWQTYYPNLLGKLTTESGALYWVPVTARTAFVESEGGAVYPGNAFTVSIRKDWLDKIDVEYKFDMTLEELFDILVAFNEKDANGNGLNDEVLSVDISDWMTGIAQLFGLPYQLVNIDSTDGKVVCPWYCDGVVDYIEYMKALYEAGCYDTSAIGSSFRNSVTETLTAENRVSLIWENIREAWVEALAPSVSGIEYAPVFATGDYKPLLMVEGHGTAPIVNLKYVVPASCQNVEAVVDLLDIVYSPEFSVLNQYGLPGKGYRIEEDGSWTQILKYQDVMDHSLEGGYFNSLTGAIPQNSVAYYTMKQWQSFNTQASKNDGAIWLNNNTDKWNRIDNSQPLSMLTAEEIETLEKIETTLITYSNETLSQLILGNYKIEDLDQYINTMKELGLDEYIAVYQARYDRYVANTNS